MPAFFPRPSDRIVCEHLASSSGDIGDKYQRLLWDSLLRRKTLPHIAFVLETPGKNFCFSFLF